MLRYLPAARRLRKLNAFERFYEVHIEADAHPADLAALRAVRVRARLLGWLYLVAQLTIYAAEKDRFRSAVVWHRPRRGTDGKIPSLQGTIMANFTLPGLDDKAADSVRSVLQERLVALIDTALTLKHIHWNVVGPNFIGVHEMLDPQVAAVQLMADAVAERIAAMGGSPNGLAGNLVEARSWNDYPVNRALVPDHLAALDVAYSGLIGDHRSAIEIAGKVDPVTEDLLIGQTGELEQFQWFVRAHLETADGTLPTADAGRKAAADPLG